MKKNIIKLATRLMFVWEYICNMLNRTPRIYLNRGVMNSFPLYGSPLYACYMLLNDGDDEMPVVVINNDGDDDDGDY